MGEDGEFGGPSPGRYTPSRWRSPAMVNLVLLAFSASLIGEHVVAVCHGVFVGG